MADVEAVKAARKTTAQVRLSRLVAASTRPGISDTEVSALLDQYAVPDEDGRLVTDTGWLGAWDVNAAAAEGWRWKAAAVAADFNFSADDASYSKGDVLAHCLEMEQKFAAMHLGVLGVRDDHAGTPYDSPRLVL